MEFARERAGLKSCSPSTIEAVLPALLFLHFCDSEGNLVPIREVKPVDAESPEHCRFEQGVVEISKSHWAPSAKSYSGDDENMWASVAVLDSVYDMDFERSSVQEH